MKLDNIDTTKPLWMIAYTYGSNRWARSDSYSEMEFMHITDMHPVEYFARAKEFNPDGKCFDFRILMEIKPNTISKEDLKWWDEGKFTRGFHLKEDLDG